MSFLRPALAELDACIEQALEQAHALRQDWAGAPDNLIHDRALCVGTSP